jgi:hypothetical protein
MINKLAKMLVLLHTAFSLGALAVAIVIFVQAKDLGWKEPAKEIVEWNMPDVTPKASVRHASLYDKSVAAYTVAVDSRNRTYSYVQPALDKLRETEPHLPDNHLYYVAKLKQLRDATDKIEVRHLKVDLPTLEKPAYEDAALENIVKSRSEYKKDLEELHKKIEELDREIKKVVVSTKIFTTQLTGTDDDNKYIQPGLYQLVDLEYKAQTQLKVEIEQIKPLWSQAIEKAGGYRYRRADLEATLSKLKGPAPKDAKKL